MVISSINKEKFVSIHEALDVIVDIFSKTSSYEIEYKKKLANYDAEDQDFLHDIEFTNLSRNEKLTYYSEMQKSRKNRRYTKDILELLDHISKVVKDSPKIVNQLNSLSNKIKETIKIQDNRIYTPRVRINSKLIKTQNLDVRFDKKNGRVKLKNQK